MRSSLLLTFLFILFSGQGNLYAQQEVKNAGPASYDLSVDPVLYTVGFANLDSRDRRGSSETINPFLKKLLDDTFRYSEKNKSYCFNFIGARMFRLIREYYPDKFDRVKKLIGQEKLFVSGSTVSVCDYKIPSPESVIRQVLYGNNYFRKEFGKESQDFLIPGYFGFSGSLPSVLAHCGLKGFSTQRDYSRQGFEIPFNTGIWTGPDGNGIVSVLNASAGGSDNVLLTDTLKYWRNRVLANGKKYGLYADYRYFSATETPMILSQAGTYNPAPGQSTETPGLHVVLTSSDQFYKDITGAQKSRLPEHSGDLGLEEYGAGSLSSQSYLKRWNRKNELLASAAEQVATMAHWLGGIKYPQGTLNEAWWLVLSNQRYSVMNGGATPKNNEYAWNDEVLSMNRFASVLESSVGVITRAMDTRTIGKAVVVYNPVPVAREDLVEATLHYPEGAPDNIVVTGPDGKEVLSQINTRTKYSLAILFSAKFQGSGLACYDVRTAKKTAEVKPTIFSGANFLENEYYKITLNGSGDVSSIIDKKLNKELLSSPARLEFQKEHPAFRPALTMDWNDRRNPPAGFVDGLPKITLVENGPVRSSLKIERTARSSAFTQIISLSSGEAGKRILFRNTVEWQSKGVSLKASFPATVSNKVVTCNMGLGTTEHPVNNEKLFEFPSREWIDLTDKSGSYGISLLEDSKFGSDFPNEKTLRLTLLYSPIANTWHDQATQDWGTHEFSYGLYSHKGDWKSGRSDWQGRCFNQPLMAFQVPAHPGFLGNSFTLIQVNTPQVDIKAMKNTESGDLILVRLQEMLGKDADNVVVTMPGKILSGYETDGQERKTGEVSLKDGKLVVQMKKSGIRSFALKLEPPAEKESEPTCFPQPLSFDQDVISNDKARRNGKFSNDGNGIPAELFSEKVKADGIEFRMGNTTDGLNNALACRGQKIPLPKSQNYNHLFVLAAATKDTSGIFRIGDLKKSVRVQGYSGYIGQFDKRTWDKLGRIKAVEKGFIKKDEVAWFGSHMHKDTTDQPFIYCYLFKYGFEVSPSSGVLQLPDNDAIRIFAITLADLSYDVVTPLSPLYDDFSARKSFPLELEKKIVSDDFTPRAKIVAVNSRNLGDLPCKVTRKDYADLHSPNGVTVKYFFSGTEKIQGKLPVQGDVISSYNDGMFDLLPTDSLQDTWFEQGEGRLLMDMQNTMEIDSIHLFSLLDTKRGPQLFSLWSSDKTEQPGVTSDPKGSGWTCIARSAPPEIEANGKIVYTVIPGKETPLNCRYLMMVSEESGHGPYYFREIDVFEKQK